jgi:hypothetical protein
MSSSNETEVVELKKEIHRLKDEIKMLNMCFRDDRDWYEYFCIESGIPKCEKHDSYCKPHVYAWIREKIGK